MAQIETALFHLVLVYILQIQGSSAVTPVFVKTGEDLILNLTETKIPPDSLVWVWQFTDEAIVTFINGSQQTVAKSYSGRLQVLKEKYSVKLQNLIKSDSGIYTAKLITPKEKELTAYNVTVQDPVSPVNLTVICKPRNSSYILTATCSAEDSSLSSTLECEGVTCNLEGGQSGGDTKSGASLHIFRLNEFIVCNHSNQISWAKSVENIKDHCTQNGSKQHIWYIVLIIVLLLTAVLVLAYRAKPCKKGNQYNTDNTIYSLPAVNAQVEKSNETAEDEICSPTTTYSTVKPVNNKESTKPRCNEKPETLYAQIEKASR